MPEPAPERTPLAMDRRVWLGLGVLLAGVLVSGAILYTGGDPGGRPGPSKASSRAPSPMLPPVVEDPGEDGLRDPEQGDEEDEQARAQGEANARDAADRVAADPLEGPVGEVTAANLETDALPVPPGGDGLISPRLSPDGKRVLAVSSGRGPRTVWVAEVDRPEADWTLVPSTEPITEADWLGPNTMVLVVEGKLFSYRVGGRMFAIVDEGDEPGVVSEAAPAPDGKLVAYVSATTANGGGDIRVVDRTTSVVRNLSATKVRVQSPAWRSDSGAVVGLVDNEVTAWALNQRGTLFRHPRVDAGRTPGWWGERLQWQEGASFSVNFVVAEPDGNPRILARQMLPSLARPAPVAGGLAWLASLKDPGTLWAVRADGSGVVVQTDAAYASQPDVVLREDGLWVAFTSNDSEAGVTRIHVGRLEGSRVVGGSMD